MKIVIDQNISYKIKSINSSTKKLEFIHLSDVGMSDKTDIEIWKYAKLNNLTILTFDNDFYNLSLINQSIPKIILFQIGNSSTKKIIEILLKRENQIIEFITSSEFESLYCLKVI